MAKKTYEQRLEGCKNPLLRKLFGIIIEKKSNLCVASNFDTISDILKFLDKAGKHICMLKIQVDRIEGNQEDILKILYAKKKELNFILFQDGKLYDGYDTIKDIYKKRFAEYVDLVTIVPNFGDFIFRAIKDGAKEVNLSDDEPRGCLAVCELSFAGFIPTVAPSEFLAICDRNSDICAGIIAQNLQVSEQCNMIKATPGVNISETSDGKNQQWNHPSKVVAQGADVLIVGRGITSKPEEEWESITRRYKEVSYQAYLEQLSN